MTPTRALILRAAPTICGLYIIGSNVASKVLLIRRNFEDIKLVINVVKIYFVDTVINVSITTVDIS